MSPEQAAIWADLFCTTPEQIAEHECLKVVGDVVGKPTNRQIERAEKALSDCQTAACLHDRHTPLRCQTRRRRGERA